MLLKREPAANHPNENCCWSPLSCKVTPVLTRSSCSLLTALAAVSVVWPVVRHLSHILHTILHTVKNTTPGLHSSITCENRTVQTMYYTHFSLTDWLMYSCCYWLTDVLLLLLTDSWALVASGWLMSSYCYWLIDVLLLLLIDWRTLVAKLLPAPPPSTPIPFFFLSQFFSFFHSTNPSPVMYVFLVLVCVSVCVCVCVHTRACTRAWWNEHILISL